MKKSLIAIALLAVGTTSAFAQSSVNLSGTIDAGIESAGGKSRTAVKSGGNAQNQITLSGAEDLGGGLKATFKVSTQFSSVSGKSNSFGNNDTYVGLEGSAGKLRLGRSFDPVYSHALTANDRFGVTGYQTIGTTLNDNGIRVSSQALYITPTYYGMTGTVSLGSDEGKKGTGVNDARGFGIRYLNGPIEATVASSRQAGFDTRFVSQVGGAYDFGVARVLLTVQHDNNLNLINNTDKKSYALGVTAPVGSGLLWASYDVKELSNRTDSHVAQLGYKYNLSKRTTMYGQVAAKNSALAGFSAQGAGVGLTHSF